MPIDASGHEGRIEIDGVEQRFRSPLDAKRAGVAIVHQELAFCPNLSVAENVCLSDLPQRGGRLDWRRLEEKAASHLDAIGADCDVREELGRLSTGRMQMVQVAAALATGAHIFVMDEPTSSLSAAEAQRLEELIGAKGKIHKLIDELAAAGLAVLRISSELPEILNLSSRILVMRNGRVARTLTRSAADEERLMHLMAGREPAPAESPAGGASNRTGPATDDAAADSLRGSCRTFS